MAGALEHYQYDTCIARWDDKAIEPAYVTFNLDAEGKVARITMKAVSPAADFRYDYPDLLFSPQPAEYPPAPAPATGAPVDTRSAACRERWCHFVNILGVAAPLK